MRQFVLTGAILIALQLIVCQTSEAQTFSVVETSMDVGGGAPFGDSILIPSLAVGVPPGVSIAGGVFLPGPPGTTGGPGPVDVDAFTFGRHFAINPNMPPLIVDFSIDAFSAGVAGTDTLFEATVAAGEQNYDVYRTNLVTMPFTNVQKHDGNGLGVLSAAPLGMFEPQPITGGPNFFEPGVDGYDSGGKGPDIYWSFDPFVAAPGPPFPAPTFSPSDVLISAVAPGFAAGPTAVFAPAGALGLDLVGFDNLDALEVFDVAGVGIVGVFDGADVILFSLEPGSAALGVGGAFAGFSAADIFFATGGGALGLAIPEAALGLGAAVGPSMNNVTAFSVVPEPNSALVLLVAFGAAGLRRRKRS